MGVVNGRGLYVRRLDVVDIVLQSRQRHANGRRVLGHVTVLGWHQPVVFVVEELASGRLVPDRQPQNKS